MAIKDRQGFVLGAITRDPAELTLLTYGSLTFQFSCKFLSDLAAWTANTDTPLGAVSRIVHSFKPSKFLSTGWSSLSEVWLGDLPFTVFSSSTGARGVLSIDVNLDRARIAAPYL